MQEVATMEVFIVFGDQKPFPGLPGCAVDRHILHAVDSKEKARALVHTLSKQGTYEYVDFEVLTLE